MKLRILAFFAIFLLVNSWAQAQVTIPYTFTSGTTASSSQVNANFTALGNSSLNRTGGNLTGNITADAGVTIDGIDLSATLGSGVFTGNRATLVSTTTPQLHLGYDGSNDLDVSVSSTGAVTFDATGSGAAFTFSDNVTIPTLTLTTLSCTGCVDSTDLAADSVGASQLVATSVSAGSYGSTTALATFTVDADGRLTAAGTTATSALTGIVESAITDDSILARVAASETISGTYTFTQDVIGRSAFRIDTTAANNPYTRLQINTSATPFGELIVGDDSTFRELRLTVGYLGGRDNSATLPFYSWTSDPDTGIWRPGANEIGFSTGGTNRLTLSTSALTSTVGFSGTTGTFSGALSAASLTVSAAILFPDGTVTAPSIAFANDTDKGFYSSGSYINVANNNIDILRIGSPSSGTEMYMQTRAAGTGANSGASFFVSRNSSGSGAAGTLGVMRRGSTTTDYIWSDGGTLRVGSARPTEDDSVAHSSGTAVGDQTSFLASKHLLGTPDDAALLAAVIGTPVRTFTYKDGRYNGETFTGIVTDWSPHFGKDHNRALNEINALGYLVGAVRALEQRLAAAEARVAELEASR